MWVPVRTLPAGPSRLTRQVELHSEQFSGTFLSSLMRRARAAATSASQVAISWSTILSQGKRNRNEETHVGYCGRDLNSRMEGIDGSISPSQSDGGVPGCFAKVDKYCRSRVSRKKTGRGQIHRLSR